MPKDTLKVQILRLEFFLARKNAQNQRITSKSKSRVSCKPVKIQYFNL